MAPRSPEPGSQPSPTLPASFTGGRYVVKRFLGEGGRKRVYLAHDNRLDRDVAFAAIKTEGLDAGGVERVRREAQAMGRLGDHPHIVTIHDIGEEDGQQYIVSQFMAGGSVEDLVSGAENRRLPVEHALRIAQEVCQALEHAHAQGIIHRDLKPGNIWLTENGTAKLGDFGLAVALDRSRLTTEGMMVGTAAYMPPEQAMGGETTAASDLYALGCVLYEMVTGRAPFVGDDAVAIISQHINTAPVAPSWHNPDCPRGLEALILRLLEKDPQQRPASAGEVRRALDSVDLAATPEPAAPAPERAPSPIYRRTFVGREAERKQLESAFNAALSGEGGLVMLVGEPGIGKTALAEQLATYVAMRGGRTLVGHCYEEGSVSLPYLPFVEAMRTYALQRDREQLAQELGSGAVEVARIVSEIRDRVQVELPPLGNPEEERFRLFQSVTAFLRNVAGVQAICLVLEDLHDGDKGTMEMLVHLARNLAGSRLLVVGTYRDVEVDRTHPLSAALAELRRAASFERVPLRGLSPDEVQRMLVNLAGQDVPWDLAEAIYRQTEGNPLFIQEIIRNAAEQGTIRREGGQWVATVDSLVGQIPEGLRDVIGRRLSGLSEGCNRVLSVASVIGREFALDVLRAVAGAGEEELLAALEEALRVSLLEERAGAREVRYRFTHALFRQTLYEEIIAPRRLRLHNEVARALEGHYAGRLEEHAAELFEHFSHSSIEEDLRKAVGYGELAAGRAGAVAANGEAARLLEQTIQVQDVVDPEDDEKRCDLLMALGHSFLSAGEPVRVAKEVGPQAFELAERLGDRRRAVAACYLAVLALVYHGGLAVFTSPEYQLWIERMDARAEPESAERAVADELKSWIHFGRREMEQCWRLRLQALELARRLDDPVALGAAVGAFADPGAPLRLNEERLQAARDFGTIPRAGMRPGRHATFLSFCCFTLLDGAERALAEAAFAELDAYAERVGDPLVRFWQSVWEVFRLRLAGELEQALEVAERHAAAAASPGGEAFGKIVSTLAALPVLRDLGRYDEALVLLPYAQPLIHGESVAARTLAEAGRSDEARRQARRIMAELSIGRDEDWTDGQTLVNLLATSVLTGDADSAQVLYQRLLPYEDWYSTSAYTTIARQLGLAALLLEDPAVARGHLATALDVAERVGDRPETARVHLALGRLLLEHHPAERVEALRHLDFALNEFRDMKMRSALEEAMRLKLKAQGVETASPETSIDAVAASVDAERPDLRPHAAPDGTVTIMFSDIEGSTEMTERLGDKRWMELLREHNAIIRGQVAAHGGFEVKSEGDGFMIAFQSARRALECAIAIQLAFTAWNAPTDAGPIRVRIGLHTGEAIKEGEDFFGKHVNLAARIAGQAEGGEILVSSLFKELVETAGDLTFGEGREVELKGLGAKHRVYEVVWQ